MPNLDGLEATRAVRSEIPTTIVMVLTAHEDPEHLSEALKAGAAGYLLKTASHAEIVESLRKALSGEFPLNQEVATRLLRRLVEEQPEDLMKEEKLPESLSPREVEVLRLVAGGQTNRQISRKLLVSQSTVKKHVRSLITRLGVSDRTQAAVKAIGLGLGAEEQRE
jgi:DNA-binding NarL/FixJ family response regulator